MIYKTRGWRVLLINDKVVGRHESSLIMPGYRPDEGYDDAEERMMKEDADTDT